MKRTNQNISEIIVYETNFSTISIRDHLKKLIKKKKLADLISLWVDGKIYMFHFLLSLK